MPRRSTVSLGVISLLTLATLVGCSSEPTPACACLVPRPPASLGTSAGNPAAGGITRRLLGANPPSSAVLDVTSGVTDLRIGIDQAPAAVISARYFSGHPVVARHGHTFSVAFNSSQTGSGAARAQIALPRAIDWTIRLDGGESDLHVDMAGGQVKAIDLSSGVSSATLTLPAPDGTLLVDEAGGASTLTVHTAAPTRVTATGGSSSVDLHGAKHTGIAGGTVFADPGFAQAPNRVELDLKGGVSTVVVRR